MMKIDLLAATQSVQDYLDAEISGQVLSQTLQRIAEAAEGLDKKQKVSFKYYVGFFEKEGKQLYLDSNKYLKEEVTELSEFLEVLKEGQYEQA